MSTYLDLLALQDLDTGLDQLRHRRVALPERSALKETTAALADVERQIAAAETHQGALNKKLTDRETEAAVVTKKLADLAKKLSVSIVPKEAEALQHEIGTVKAQRATIEDIELELMGELEPIEMLLDTLRADRTGLVVAVDSARSALAEVEALVDADIDAATPRRNTTAQGVTGPVLAQYEKMRGHFKGIAITRVEHGVCGGCRMKVSNTQMEALRVLRPGEVGECEECGRFLLIAPS